MYRNSNPKYLGSRKRMDIKVHQKSQSSLPGKQEHKNKFQLNSSIYLEFVTKKAFLLLFAAKIHLFELTSIKNK